MSHADVTFFKHVAAQAHHGSDSPVDDVRLVPMMTLESSTRRKGKLINVSTLSHPNAAEIVASVAIALQVRRALPFVNGAARD